MSKKVSKLNDAIKAISLGTEDSLKKSKIVKKTKKGAKRKRRCWGYMF